MTFSCLLNMDLMVEHVFPTNSERPISAGFCAGRHQSHNKRFLTLLLLGKSIGVQRVLPLGRFCAGVQRASATLF
jgi:hypothetical protein